MVNMHATDVPVLLQASIQLVGQREGTFGLLKSHIPNPQRFFFRTPIVNPA